MEEWHFARKKTNYLWKWGSWFFWEHVWKWVKISNIICFSKFPIQKRMVEYVFSILCFCYFTSPLKITLRSLLLIRWVTHLNVWYGSQLLQKQPTEVLFKKRCYYKFRKIHRKTNVSESLFSWACNVIKNETLAQVFSYDFFFWNFLEHLLPTASPFNGE